MNLTLVIVVTISCLRLGSIEGAFDFEQLVERNLVNLKNNAKQPFLTGEERYNVLREDERHELDYEYDFGASEQERDLRNMSRLRSMRKIGHNVDQIRQARLYQRGMYLKYLSVKDNKPTEASDLLEKIHALDWEIGILNGQNREIESNRALYDDDDNQ